MDQRGQAHLPDLRAALISSVIPALNDFHGRIQTQLSETRGWEGGLAPAGSPNSTMNSDFLCYLKAEQQRLRSSFFKPADMLVHEIDLERVRTRS